MSIDLSKVTAISDKYGPYAQVADASGRVIWSAVPPTVDIKVTNQGGGTFSYITYNGVKYTTSCTITANVGDVIRAYVETVGYYEAAIYRRNINTGSLETLSEIYTGETTYDYVILPTTREITFYDEGGSGYITFHEDI